MTGLAIVCAILCVALTQAAIWDQEHLPRRLPLNGFGALAALVLALVFGVLGGE